MGTAKSPKPQKRNSFEAKPAQAQAEPSSNGLLMGEDRAEFLRENIPNGDAIDADKAAAWREYREAQLAEREKTARLRALRLAKSMH